MFRSEVLSEENICGWIFNLFLKVCVSENILHPMKVCVTNKYFCLTIFFIFPCLIPSISIATAEEVLPNCFRKQNLILGHVVKFFLNNFFKHPERFIFLWRRKFSNFHNQFFFVSCLKVSKKKPRRSPLVPNTNSVSSKKLQLLTNLEMFEAFNFVASWDSSVSSEKKK